MTLGEEIGGSVDDDASSLDCGCAFTTDESGTTILGEETNGSVDGGSSSNDDSCGGSRDGSGATIASNLVSAEEALANIEDHIFAIEECDEALGWFWIISFKIRMGAGVSQDR